MTALFLANIAPIMFVMLIALLMIGYPVAFSLSANGLLFGAIAMHYGLLGPDLLQALPQRIFGIMSNETLLAIPFFTFMGLILERSGMAEDLLDTVGQMFGSVRGGLAYAVVFVGALLAATTGVTAASVISMGLISLPIMLRYGYDRRLASGVIAASGTLAQIIPPSLVLIVMADQLGRSVGDMYEGAFIPGIGLAVLYAIYIAIITMAKPTWTPALPLEAITIREPGRSAGYRSLIVIVALSVVAGWALSAYDVLHPIWACALVGAVDYVLALADKYLKLRVLSLMTRQVIIVMMPPLALIFLVLGTIFLGIATPTEGGAMGSAGALILALANRRLDRKLLRQAMDTTAKLSSFVMFILVGSTVFSLVFRGVNGDLWVENLLTSLPGGQIGFLVVVNLLSFLLAFFLDFFELAFIIVPLLGPVAEKLGIDLIWFGVLLGVTMQTSFLHPPFGYALFYLRSVAPSEEYTDRVTGKRLAPLTTGQIYWGSIPFIMIQLVMVGLVIAFPQLVLASVETKHFDINQIQIIAPEIPEGANPSLPGSDVSAPAPSSDDPMAPPSDH
ncbi:MAG TPA: TRAP transporter large permease subunit [Stellaceae bacterium]|nr:TRAP transporter large permease subunit [Stellaceae bacterium]